MHFRARGFAVLFLAASTLLAQDWKSAESLPGVDESGLTPTQKALALKTLRDTACSCGCSMKLAECRFADPKCAFSTNLAHIAMTAAREGKDEAGIRAALDASPWSHPQQPKLLDDPVRIPISGSPTMGPSNAAITLVEFSDFQCPYCAQAVPELRALLSAFPTQVRLVFKEFPLDMHPQAGLAAAAAVAADKQGKFWAMHDALYSSRDLSRSAILDIANKIGLDPDRFASDLNSASVQQIISRDEQDGEAAGVDGTPAVFVNGQRYNGSLELAEFRQIIDAQLKHPATSPAAN